MINCWTGILAILLVGCGPSSKDTGPADTEGSDTQGNDTDSGAQDLDGDGSLASADCDDTDPAIHPDATEVCDGVDNNCDGEVDESAATDASTWYADRDGDGYGDAAATTRGCTQPEGYGDTVGDCDDGDGSVYPGAPEVCGDGAVNDCAGDAATAMAACALSGTRSLADADLKLVGEAADDSAGTAVAGAGDVDEDGRSDVAVGVSEESSAASAAGAAYVLLGGGALDGASGSRSLSGADLKLTGEAMRDRAGIAVSGAGDVDGDGRGDLVVGAYSESTGGASAGAAYLLLGGGALLSASGTQSLSGAELKLTGEAAYDYAGQPVSSAGDVDGDGTSDLAVGAPYSSASGAYAGAGYLLLGGGALSGASGTQSLSIADLKLTGEAKYDAAGVSFAGAGDVDGDGLGDLALGAPNEDTGGSYAGAAYLSLGGGALLGASGTLGLADADLKLTGLAANDYAGVAVAGAGEVDGDGYGDLLVGAQGEHTGGRDAGATYLLLGGGALAGATGTASLSVADLVLTGEAAGDASGSSLSTAGDVEGDGRIDVLIGARDANTIAGAAFLLYGGGALLGASGTASLSGADLKVTGEAAYDSAGSSVAGVGDCNGDGRGDLLVSAPGESSVASAGGAAYLVLGRSF